MEAAFRKTSGPVTALPMLKTIPPSDNFSISCVYIRKSLPEQPPLALPSKDACWSVTSVPMPAWMVKGVFFR